jgi:5-methylthioadenosine/S-adenosylhomocysteine deaminase
MAILLKGALVATGYPVSVSRSDVLIERGAISRVGIDLAVADSTNTEVIDCSGYLLTPGFVNGHIHLNQLLNRGFLDGLSTEALLRDMHSRHDTKSDDDRYWASLVSVGEGLKCGTTTFCAFATSVGLIGKAMLDAGVRGTVTIAKKDQWWGEGNPRQVSTAEILHDLRDALASWNSPKVNVSIGAASDRAASEPLLRGLLELARSNDTRLFIHAAEGQASIDLSLAHRRKRPIEFLSEIGFLTPHVTLVHASNVADFEVDLLAKSGASVCHCPVSNAKTAAGTMPLDKIWQAGIPLCLGTDAASTGNTNNILIEAYFAGLLHMASNTQALFPSASDLFALLTVNGANAVGLSGVVGEIREGYQADIVLWDLKHSAFLTNLCNPISSLIYCPSELCAAKVFIGGTLVYNNKPLLFDFDDAVRHVSEYALTASQH